MPKSKSDFYQLGYVSRTHGIRGQVVIKLDVDDPSAYKKLKHVFIGEDFIEYKVKEAAIREGTALILLDGYNNINQVEHFVGKGAFLPLSELPLLDDRSLYLHEAIGMNVVEESLGSLGPIVEVYDVPTQPVAAVMVNDKEVLFPLLRTFIKHVDRENNILHMVFPDGLLEVYTITKD